MEMSKQVREMCDLAAEMRKRPNPAAMPRHCLSIQAR
jgi:hypothetical protein